MDLRGVRPYRPGDPVRDLHARSWARVGIPVVREYQQEYFSRIGVVLDCDCDSDRKGARKGSDDSDGADRLEAALSLSAGVLSCLSRGEALIDLLVIGDRVHPLTLGRSLGTFEQALDLLACVQPGPPFAAERVLSRLRAYLPRLSCVIFLALRWDEERSRLAARIRECGVGCKVLLVAAGGRAGGDEAPWPVSPAAIRGGEALSL
jgi:uncharacterized protein (DUF58 family)